MRSRRNRGRRWAGAWGLLFIPAVMLLGGILVSAFLLVYSLVTGFRG